MKLFCTFLIFIRFLSTGQTNLFDKGYWYKIGVTENGIYKINKNFLDEIGIDYSQPNTIKVFGNGIDEMEFGMNAISKNRFISEILGIEVVFDIENSNLIAILGDGEEHKFKKRKK